MSEYKQEIADGVRARRQAALGVLEPQWKQCKRTRPRGHIRDGTVGRNHYAHVCLYCGHPDRFDMDVLFLEKCVAEAHLYPIVRAEEKAVFAS